MLRGEETTPNTFAEALPNLKDARLQFRVEVLSDSPGCSRLPFVEETLQVQMREKSECAKNPDGSASARALCSFLKNGEQNLQAILSLPTSITSVHLLHAGGSKCRLVFVGFTTSTASLVYLGVSK